MKKKEKEKKKKFLKRKITHKHAPTAPTPPYFILLASTNCLKINNLRQFLVFINERFLLLIRCCNWLIFRELSRFCYLDLIKINRFCEKSCVCTCTILLQIITQIRYSYTSTNT